MLVCNVDGEERKGGSKRGDRQRMSQSFRGEEMLLNRAGRVSAGKTSQESEVLNSQGDGACYRRGGGRGHISIHLHAWESEGSIK